MKKKLLYIAPARSSFVEVDLSILNPLYDVVVNTYAWKIKKKVPFFLIDQFLFLLKNLPHAKLILISSAGFWSVLPVLLGKAYSIPVLIIINGSETASFPEINYGSLRKPLLRNACKVSVKFADLLLPVSESLIKTKNTYLYEERVIEQGIQHFFPKIKTPWRVIFNGLDTEFWQSEELSVKEPDSFLSVFSPNQFFLKGGDLIVEVANLFPECNFYMAGINETPPAIIAPKNVHFLGYLNAGELKNQYNRCQFHFQLSIFEGFGCTLCEAMLCECIPIGSEVNYIPDIIGSTGYLLNSRNSEKLAAIIRNARAAVDKKERGKAARSRIVEKFSIERRHAELLRCVEEQTSS